MIKPRFFPIIPGCTLPGDWYPGTIPENIQVGVDSVIDSTSCFKNYSATGAVGFRVGNHVTIWRTALAVEDTGTIEIGDYCYLANASLMCRDRITLGARVVVAGAVAIVDSDFHPLAVAPRIADTIALSLVGNRADRPSIASRPVVIEDDVWIGYNATILKGVRIGEGAVIAPGSVVNRDVPPHIWVAGNPARPIEESDAGIDR